MSLDTCLLYVSSEHAVSRSDSRYRLTIPNTVFVDKCVKLVVHTITIENIFPNINKYRNTWEEKTGGTKSITIKNYTASELITAFNAASSEFVLSLNGDGKFVITSTTNTTIYTTGHRDLFDLLGFQDQVQTVGNVHPLAVNTTSLTANTVPNLGGEKLVFIRSNQLVDANLCHGGDGTLHDVMTCIPLSETNYGFSKSVRANDLFIDDVEYRDEKNINTIYFEILDSKFRPLDMPSNYHLRMVLKVFHKEHKPSLKEGGR